MERTLESSELPKVVGWIDFRAFQVILHRSNLADKLFLAVATLGSVILL